MYSENKTRLSLDGLAKHAMSYGRSAELIHRNLPRFKKELADAMALYLVDGKLQGAVISWMTIYRR